MAPDSQLTRKREAKRLMAEDRGLSLVEYARKKRTADCAVCALPDDIRQQMAGASDKKIKKATVIAWLKEQRDIQITASDMTTHVNGHHDSSS